MDGVGCSMVAQETQINPVCNLPVNAGRGNAGIFHADSVSLHDNAVPECYKGGMFKAFHKDSIMSRYTIPAKDKRYSVSVGWDSPMNTFFGQVQDLKAANEENEMVLWIGGNYDEVPTVEKLQNGIEPYATIPDHVLNNLSSDRANTPQTTRLQQMARKMMTQETNDKQADHSYSR